jgi:hypothetical protein
MKMERFACHGWLRVSVSENDPAIKVHFIHRLGHTKYIDIALSDDVVKMVERLKGLPAAKVCD